MYIRKTSYQRKGKTYENYLLVESVSTPQGPRQKVICSLGNLKPRPKEEWLALARKVERALAPQPALFPPEQEEEVTRIVRRINRKIPRIHPPKASRDTLVEVIPAEVTVSEAREAGAVHLAHAVWERLGFPAILQEVGFSPSWLR